MAEDKGHSLGNNMTDVGENGRLVYRERLGECSKRTDLGLAHWKFGSIATK